MSTQTPIEKKNFSSYTHGEGKTAHGQHVEFTHRSDIDTAVIQQFLLENIRHIRNPESRKKMISHGGYGAYSRYKIIQHKYSGGSSECGGGGFLEVLEIKNPPDKRNGIVTHYYDTWKGSFFVEWQTTDHAISCFEKFWVLPNSIEKIRKLPGFIRSVKCGPLTPWFYAIGNQELVGDYAFPEGMQDDPVYCLGKKFVFTDSDGLVQIKTCLGCRFIQGTYKDQDYRTVPYRRRLVSWNDGTCTEVSDSGSDYKGIIRPLEDSELWIDEAMTQFKQLLSGHQTEIKIDFTNGDCFVGKLKTANKIKHTEEGMYFAEVNIKGEKKPRKGNLDFKPTADEPDVVTSIVNRFKKDGKEVERVSILKKQTTQKGKKWKGVFFGPPNCT